MRKSVEKYLDKFSGYREFETGDLVITEIRQTRLTNNLLDGYVGLDGKKYSSVTLAQLKIMLK